jgi:hypothetical protein
VQNHFWNAHTNLHRKFEQGEPFADALSRCRRCARPWQEVLIIHEIDKLLESAEERAFRCAHGFRTYTGGSAERRTCTRSEVGTEILAFLLGACGNMNHRWRSAMPSTDARAHVSTPPLHRIAERALSVWRNETFLRLALTQPRVSVHVAAQHI